MLNATPIKVAADGARYRQSAYPAFGATLRAREAERASAGGPAALEYSASDTIDSDTARLWIRQHLAGQRDGALHGYGEQYRPEEREAQNVPLNTEIPGFIRDFEGFLSKHFNDTLADRFRDGHQKNRCGEIAEKFYALAAEVKTFRGAGTHEYMTCLELADRFDRNIKYRLAEQIVREERAKNPALSPEEASRIQRMAVGAIDGLVAGKLQIHQGREDTEELPLGQHTMRVTANNDNDAESIAQRN